VSVRTRAENPPGNRAVRSGMDAREPATTADRTSRLAGNELGVRHRSEGHSAQPWIPWWQSNPFYKE
jgi:hypothetical protein